MSGLPRGLAISATLSEYLLRAFDNEVSAMRGVRFYSRYVDDIILVLSPREQVDEVVSACADLLPQNLQFSRRKSKQYEFQITRGTNPPVPERAIDFLGYCLQVSTTYRSNKILKRDVGLDIAPGKVRKIKQRIARSILEFNCGGRFDDLHDRIRFLTGNYQFYDDNQAQVRFAGLRYNYPLIDAPTSTALRELDAFLHNGLFSAHPKNRLKPILSVAQARLLWDYCFKKGFEANQFFSFSARDIYRITKCWNHA